MVHILRGSHIIIFVPTEVVASHSVGVAIAVVFHHQVQRHRRVATPLVGAGEEVRHLLRGGHIAMLVPVVGVASHSVGVASVLVVHRQVQRHRRVAAPLVGAGKEVRHLLRGGHIAMLVPVKTVAFHSRRVAGILVVHRQVQRHCRVAAPLIGPHEEVLQRVDRGGHSGMLVPAEEVAFHGRRVAGIFVVHRQEQRRQSVASLLGEEAPCGIHRGSRQVVCTIPAEAVAHHSRRVASQRVVAHKMGHIVAGLSHHEAVGGLRRYSVASLGPPGEVIAVFLERLQGYGIAIHIVAVTGGAAHRLGVGQHGFHGRPHQAVQRHRLCAAHREVGVAERAEGVAAVHHTNLIAVGAGSRGIDIGGCRSGVVEFAVAEDGGGHGSGDGGQRMGALEAESTAIGESTVVEALPSGTATLHTGASVANYGFGMRHRPRTAEAHTGQTPHQVVAAGGELHIQTRGRGAHDGARGHHARGVLAAVAMCEGGRREDVSVGIAPHHCATLHRVAVVNLHIQSCQRRQSVAERLIAVHLYLMDSRGCVQGERVAHPIVLLMVDILSHSGLCPLGPRGIGTIEHGGGVGNKGIEETPLAGSGTAGEGQRIVPRQHDSLMRHIAHHRVDTRQVLAGHIVPLHSGLNTAAGGVEQSDGKEIGCAVGQKSCGQLVLGREKSDGSEGIGGNRLPVETLHRHHRASESAVACLPVGVVPHGPTRARRIEVRGGTVAQVSHQIAALGDAERIEGVGRDRVTVEGPVAEHIILLHARPHSAAAVNDQMARSVGIYKLHTAIGRGLYAQRDVDIHRSLVLAAHGERVVVHRQQASTAVDAPHIVGMAVVAQRVEVTVACQRGQEFAVAEEIYRRRVGPVEAHTLRRHLAHKLFHSFIVLAGDIVPLVAPFRALEETYGRAIDDIDLRLVEGAVGQVVGGNLKVVVFRDVDSDDGTRQVLHLDNGVHALTLVRILPRGPARMRDIEILNRTVLEIGHIMARLGHRKGDHTVGEDYVAILLPSEEDEIVGYHTGLQDT